MSHGDSINKLSVVLTSYLRASISIPAEELTGEAASQGNVAVVGNTSDALVFAAEVTHASADVSCIDGPELEVFGSDRAELLVILPGDLDDVAAISLRLGDAGTCISVVDSEVVVVTVVTDDQVVAGRRVCYIPD